MSENKTDEYLSKFKFGNASDDIYRCSKCHHDGFYGKAGKWVCNHCLTPIPSSTIVFMEFEDKKPVIRVRTKELTVFQNH